MCLPVGFLKCFISFEAIIVLLIGLASLSGTIYIDVNHSLYFGTLDDVIGSNPEQGIITALYVISSLLILFGFSGLVGGWKKIGTLLFCFNIGNFFMAISFGVVGIMGFLLANQEIFDLNNCLNSGIFKDSSLLNNAYLDMENVFCQYNNSQGCQCYYNQTIQPNQTSAVEYYSNTNASLPVRIQQCEYYQDEAGYNITLLSQIESDYSCSGWCTAYPIYLLTDVNAGYPESSCYDAILNYASQICVVVGAVAISVFCIMVICITCVLCLCCHPTKKQKGNFYSRMTYYDE